MTILLASCSPKTTTQTIPETYWSISAKGGDYSLPPKAMSYIRKGARLFAGISRPHIDDEGICDSPDGIDPRRHYKELVQVSRLYDTNNDRVVSLDEAVVGFKKLCLKYK